MIDDQKSQKVAAMAPRQADFEHRVRQLAKDSNNVKFTFHARERMAERDINIRVALTVIREGAVSGKIIAGNAPGEWKAKIVRNMKGRRDVGAVILLVKNDRIVVKTLEWEDVR